MRTNVEKNIELDENKGLQDRIQRLRYDLVSDFKNKQSRESLLMFVMDV